MPTAKKPQVFQQNPTPLVVIGDFAWDVLIKTNSALAPGGDTFGEVMLAPGGSAANVAVWAQRCALETTFIGKIGSDPLARLAQENMTAESVQTRFISSQEHLTGSVAVWVDHTGERSMVSGKGADFYLQASELPEAPLIHCQHLHLTGWSLFTDPPRSAIQQAAGLAKDHGASLSLDPASFQRIEDMGPKAFLEVTSNLAIDILFPNYEEGRVLSGFDNPPDITQALHERYHGATIILKLDAEGSYIYDGNNNYIIQAIPSVLCDATGAGDTFAGSFLAAYLQGVSLEQAGQFASRVSAWVIERNGARPTPDKALYQILKGTKR